MLHSTLSLDLHCEVSSNVRDQLNEALQAFGWEKVLNFASIWTRQHPPGVYFPNCVSQAKKEAANAAEVAGLAHYSASVVVSKSPPQIWQA